jgi:hypothetical protein
MLQNSTVHLRLTESPNYRFSSTKNNSTDKLGHGLELANPRKKKEALHMSCLPKNGHAKQKGHPRENVDGLL